MSKSVKFIFASLFVASIVFADAVAPKLLVNTLNLSEKSSTPSNPASGTYSLYPKNDGSLYILNSSGVESAVGGPVAGEIKLDASHLFNYWGIAAPSLVWTEGASLANGGLIGTVDASSGAVKTRDIEILTGDQTFNTSSLPTGTIETRTGNNSGSGSSGPIYLTTGNSASGGAGGIFLQTGVGNSVGGDINFTTGGTGANKGSAIFNINHLVVSGNDLTLPTGAADPTPYSAGASYWNTSTNLFKIYNGSAWKTFVDTNSTQTLSGKTINGSQNTVSNIGYSSLNLTGAIVNADVSSSAAIAYSKLNLGLSIVNADVSTSAAIALNKLAATTVNRALVSDGSGFVSPATTTATEIGYVNGVTSAIQTQLNGKEPSVTAGTSAQYWRGDKAWTDFNTSTRAATLTGLDTSTATTITATDTVLSSAGKLQGQVSANTTSISGKEPTIASGTASQVWHGNKTWSKVDLSTDTTSTLAVGAGGTGQVTAQGARTALLPSQSGNATKYLQTDGTDVSWAAASGGSGSGGLNLLTNYNPEFSGGTTNWTASAGSFATTTGSGDTVFDSGGYATWDSSAAGQTLCSNLTAVNGLASTTRSGMWGFYTRVPSGSATHIYYVSDGTNKISPSLTITSSTTAAYQYVNFPVPSSGSIKGCIESVASNEPSIDIDHAHLGEALNVVSVPAVGDIVDYGTITVGATGGTPPTKASSKTIDRVRGFRIGKYWYGYYEYSQPDATAAANGTGDYLFSLPPGIVADSNYVTFNTSTASTAARQFPGQGLFSGNLGANAQQSQLVAIMYNSTQFRLVGLIGAANNVAGSAALNFASASVMQFGGWIQVPVVGWSAAQSAAAATQTNYDWTSYTPTFTGFGTATSIDCWHKRDGANLLLRCKFVKGTNTGVEARVSLPNSLVSDSTKVASIQGANGIVIDSTSSAGNARYPLIESGVGYVTFGQTAASSATGFTKLLGTNFDNSSTMFFTASIPISGWFENNKAPTLTGSITSDYSAGSYKTEYGAFGGASEQAACTTGTCTLYQNGFLTSATFSATGIYTLVWPTYQGKIPFCKCMNRLSSATALDCEIDTLTATGGRLITYGGSGTNTNSAAGVECTWIR